MWLIRRTEAEAEKRDSEAPVFMRSENRKEVSSNPFSHPIYICNISPQFLFFQWIFLILWYPLYSYLNLTISENDLMRNNEMEENHFAGEGDNAENGAQSESEEDSASGEPLNT